MDQPWRDPIPISYIRHEDFSKSVTKKIIVWSKNLKIFKKEKKLAEKSEKICFNLSFAN